MQLLSSDTLNFDPKSAADKPNLDSRKGEEVKRSMASKDRSGSLASRDPEDLNKVSIIARENTKDPIKISFSNIDYKVRVKSTAQERLNTG